MIYITFNPKKYELKIKGHANQNVKGHDIVCAAVSVLTYTLADSVDQSRDMCHKVDIILDEGEGKITCKPKAEYEGTIARTYWTILNGMNSMAETYPKFVKFSVQG